MRAGSDPIALKRHWHSVEGTDELLTSRSGPEYNQIVATVHKKVREEAVKAADKADRRRFNRILADGQRKRKAARAASPSTSEEETAAEEEEDSDFWEGESSDTSEGASHAGAPPLDVSPAAGPSAPAAGEDSDVHSSRMGKGKQHV